jgi:hypothetical protein
MTITLVSKRRIDWARPDGCPAGFETRYVVSGNSDGVRTPKRIMQVVAINE